MQLRSKEEIRDRIRFSAVMNVAASASIQARLAVEKVRNHRANLLTVEKYCKAARISPINWDRRRLEAKITALMDKITLEDACWDELWPRSGQASLRKAIILKSPNVSSGERGVLLVSFEEQWVRIFRHANIARLAEDYELVLAPSWSPPHDAAILVAAKLWPRPLFHLVSNLNDLDTFSRLMPTAVTVPLLASNWVHPDLFAPKPSAEKPYDLLMIANFAQYKRHFLLFKALRQLPDVRVLLIGHPMEGRTADMILELATKYGVVDQITLRTQVSDEELVESLGKAKLSVILSRQEGSCVAVVESLFADTPVLLLKNAIIGSRCFINDATGVLADENHLATDIRTAIDRYERFGPRKWVTEHRIDCFGSTTVLNRALKDHTIARGDAWTQDIVAHHWRPNPSYVSKADYERFAGQIENFNDHYGIGIDYTDFSVEHSPNAASDLECAQRD